MRPSDPVARLAVLAAAVVLAAACSAGGAGRAAASTSASPAAASAPALGGKGTPLAPPTPGAPPLVTLPGDVRLSAPSASVVWALANGAFLFESGDRGATWSRRAVPAERVGDISFISERVGWASYFDDARVLTIWRTDDGGATWSVARTISDFQANEIPSGVTLVDARRGFLSTRIGDGRPTVFRTLDGGATWSRSAPLPVTSQVGPVVESGGVLLAPAGAAVVRSADGGETWTVAGSTPDGQPVAAIASAAHWVEWPWGSATEDGGRTWRPWATSYQQAAGVGPAIVFAGGSAVVYATVRGGIQRSDDGGAIWVTLRTPGT